MRIIAPTLSSSVAPYRREEDRGRAASVGVADDTGLPGADESGVSRHDLA